MKPFSERVLFVLMFALGSLGLAAATGNPLTGTWKLNVEKSTFAGNISAYAPAESDFMVTLSAPGRVTIEDPNFKQTISGALDGSAIAVNGPTIPDGMTVSYKPAGKHKWDYAQLLSGKVFTKGTMTVSADGKLLTRTIWVPGNESEKSVAVYDKQ